MPHGRTRGRPRVRVKPFMRHLVDVTRAAFTEDYGPQRLEDEDGEFMVFNLGLDDDTNEELRGYFEKRAGGLNTIASIRSSLVDNKVKVVRLHYNPLPRAGQPRTIQTNLVDKRFATAANTDNLLIAIGVDEWRMLLQSVAQAGEGGATVDGAAAGAGRGGATATDAGHAARAGAVTAATPTKRKRGGADGKVAKVKSTSGAAIIVNDVATAITDEDEETTSSSDAIEDPPSTPFVQPAVIEPASTAAAPVAPDPLAQAAPIPTLDDLDAAVARGETVRIDDILDSVPGPVTDARWESARSAAPSDEPIMLWSSFWPLDTDTASDGGVHGATIVGVDADKAALASAPSQVEDAGSLGEGYTPSDEDHALLDEVLAVCREALAGTTTPRPASGAAMGLPLSDDDWDTFLVDVFGPSLFCGA